MRRHYCKLRGAAVNLNVLSCVARATVVRRLKLDLELGYGISIRRGRKSVTEPPNEMQLQAKIFVATELKRFRSGITNHTLRYS